METLPLARCISIRGSHGERLTQDIDQLLIQLQQKNRDVDLYSLGDIFLLEHRFEAAPTTEIARQFGDQFVAKLADVLTGAMVRSGRIRLRRSSGVCRRPYRGPSA